jgi:hypothetical protein
MVAKGLSVLSVDDGRQPKKDYGISARRAKRALMVCADEVGYQPGWGRATRFTAQADVAFLDTVAHWSGAIRSLLEACQHMKGFAITLMPQRAEFGNLEERDWEVAYRALIEDASGMRVTWSHRYDRPSGLPAIVFFARSRHRAYEPFPIERKRLCERCGSRPMAARAKKYCAPCKPIATQEASVRDQEHRRRWQTENRDAILERRRLRRRDPAVKAKERDQRRARREANVDAAKVKERAARRRRIEAMTPDELTAFREANREYGRNWWRAKSEQERQELTRLWDSTRAKKAAVSGTAAKPSILEEAA